MLPFFILLSIILPLQLKSFFHVGRAEAERNSTPSHLNASSSVWNDNLCPCSSQALQGETFSAHKFIKDNGSHYGKTSSFHFLQKLWVASHCSIVTQSKTLKKKKYIFPHLLKFSTPSNLKPYKQKCKSFPQYKPPKAKWLQFIPEEQFVNYPIRSVQVLQQSPESSVKKIQTSVIKKLAKVFEQEHNHSTRKQILCLTYNRLFHEFP